MQSQGCSATLQELMANTQDSGIPQGWVNQSQIRGGWAEVTSRVPDWTSGGKGIYSTQHRAESCICGGEGWTVSQREAPGLIGYYILQKAMYAKIRSLRFLLKARGVTGFTQLRVSICSTSQRYVFTAFVQVTNTSEVNA